MLSPGSATYGVHLSSKFGHIVKSMYGTTTVTNTVVPMMSMSWSLQGPRCWFHEGLPGVNAFHKEGGAASEIVCVMRHLHAPLLRV